jgi:hypothetical protein
MNFLLNLIIFLFVLFIYIHITHQLKTSEDLEIYELDYTNNQHLQEVCDIKQPVLFEFNSICPEFYENMNNDNIVNYDKYDVKLKDINDYWNPDIDNVDYLVLPYQSAMSLISSDPKSNYFIENNNEFVEESGLNQEFYNLDGFLKPTMNLQTKFDILSGSKNCITPLRYHTNYRQFYSVNSGKITIKMTPRKSTKYLHLIKDYENYEFRSPVNVWNTQKQYMNDMDKMKFLEFDVNPGYVLYIPPYWWYSIKFSGDNNLICGVTYNSIMNYVANIPNLTLYFIQQHNIKKKITKTLDIDRDGDNDRPTDSNNIIEPVENQLKETEVSPHAPSL